MSRKIHDLLKDNVKDPNALEAIQSVMLRNARITALVLGSFLIIALVAVVYGFVQAEQTKVAIKLSEEHMIKVEQCIREAQKLQAFAQEAQLIAAEANKMTAEQLKDCLQRNK